MDVHAQVLVNACVDVRFIDALVDWLRAEGVRGQYDLRTHEGAALTVNHWLASDATIDRLHQVREIWIVDHEERGAYQVQGQPNTRANRVRHRKAAQVQVQTWVGKPTRIFYHPLGPDGLGAAAVDEVPG